jgi:hypothetical protein
MIYSTFKLQCSYEGGCRQKYLGRIARDEMCGAGGIANLKPGERTQTIAVFLYGDLVEYWKLVAGRERPRRGI